MNIQGFKSIIYSIITILLLYGFTISCNRKVELPKPKGYFRITLPANEYRLMDSIYPFTFEFPNYAKITTDQYSPNEKGWINVVYPQFDGKLHLSYKAIDKKNNLHNLTEDARTLALKHIPMASGIENVSVFNKDMKVFGTIYKIKGSSVASPFQFYLTDSTNHFIRGALYFEVLPNNDSLQPVIDHIEESIEHLITTFRWKR